MLAGQRIDGAVAFELHECGQHTRHVAPSVKRHMAELFKPHFVDRLAGFQKSLIPFHVTGCQLGYLGAHRFSIAGVVKYHAIVKTDTVIRRHGPQVNIVGKAAVAQRPQFFQQKWRRYDGGASIESEAVLLVNVGSAARRIELFQYSRPVAPRT